MNPEHETNRRTQNRTARPSKHLQSAGLIGGGIISGGGQAGEDGAAAGGAGGDAQQLAAATLAAAACPARRRPVRENLHDFLAKKRQIFLVQVGRGGRAAEYLGVESRW